MSLLCILALQTGHLFRGNWLQQLSQKLWPHGTNDRWMFPSKQMEHKNRCMLAAILCLPCVACSLNAIISALLSDWAIDCLPFDFECLVSLSLHGLQFQYSGHQSVLVQLQR